MRYEILDAVNGNTIDASEDFCVEHYPFYRLVKEPIVATPSVHTTAAPSWAFRKI
jgi:hypothetical protein